jgi:hypothetical protein
MKSLKVGHGALRGKARNDKGWGVFHSIRTPSRLRISQNPCKATSDGGKRCFLGTASLPEHRLLKG